jgi:hypothetical protein
MNPDPVLEDVSEAIADIYGSHYAIDRTTVSAYLAENVLICVLEDLDARYAGGGEDDGAILAARQEFQRRHEPEFCAAVERLTLRRVKTFLSATHVGDGIAAEVFFLADAA